MIRVNFGFGPVKRILVPAALSLAIIIVLSASPVLAQAERERSDVSTPVEEYARQVEQLKKSYPDLGKKIEDSAKSFDDLTDVAKARKEIEELRAVVGDMLGAVSDNGTVSQLGVKALNHARNKLKTLDQEVRFKPEEKQFLIDQWRRVVSETERAPMISTAHARNSPNSCAPCRRARISLTN